MDTATIETPKIRAAQYVRMSTEHQRYSIAYQSAANAAYASEHGIEIVRTYSDAGVSGLHIKGRTALKQLLADAISGGADFAMILTYDISRWGRFQDPDQSAHYEFICKDAGVPVVYCAEPFHDDGSLPSTLVKQLKRAMAAEYSRELSVRISRVHRGLAGQGLWVGGPPGYGFRRETVAMDGTSGETLEAGRCKSVPSHSVRLAPGPEVERQMVRRIYRMFLFAGMSRALIARVLNAEGVPASSGARWSPHRIDLILFDEKYVGTAVYGKTSRYLGRGKQRHPKSTWLRVEHAFEAIVDRTMFDLAQRNAGRRRRRPSRDEMLEGLRTLLSREGFLTGSLIDESEWLARAEAYRRTFGSLLVAYDLIGYAPSQRAWWGARRGAGRTHRRQYCDMSDADMIAGLHSLYARAGHLCIKLIDQSHVLPGYDRYRRRIGGMARLYEIVGHTPTARQLSAVRLRNLQGPKPAARTKDAPASE